MDATQLLFSLEKFFCFNSVQLPILEVNFYDFKCLIKVLVCVELKCMNIKNLTITLTSVSVFDGDYR
jgi:hypothetical protein